MVSLLLIIIKSGIVKCDLLLFVGETNNISLQKAVFWKGTKREHLVVSCKCFLHILFIIVLHKTKCNKQGEMIKFLFQIFSNGFTKINFQSAYGESKHCRMQTEQWWPLVMLRLDSCLSSALSQSPIWWVYSQDQEGFTNIWWGERGGRVFYGRRT